jgi:hypothetical protein
VRDLYPTPLDGQHTLVSTALSDLAVSPRTIVNMPAIRLGLKIYFHHLAPPTGSQNPEDLSAVSIPPVCGDPAGEHPAVDEVEGVVGIIEPVDVRMYQYE